RFESRNELFLSFHLRRTSPRRDYLDLGERCLAASRWAVRFFMVSRLSYLAWLLAIATSAFKNRPCLPRLSGTSCRPFCRAASSFLSSRLCISSFLARVGS